MLVSLSIKNFALIDNLEINFDKGLNIITGETGAGKSIIIEALSFVLGGRADKDMIRTGCSKAEVEAIFEVDEKNRVIDELKEMGFYDAEDDFIIVYRELMLNGRNRCKINNKTVNISTLKYFAQKLIDIHSQDEYQMLFDWSTHQSLLDAFGSGELDELKKHVNNLYNTYMEYDREIRRLQEEGNNPLEEEFIKYQLNEINAANLKAEEEEQLLRARKVMTNAEKIYDALFYAYSTLYDNKNKRSVIDELGEVINKLKNVSQYDKEIENMLNRLNDLYYQIEDISGSLRHYMEGLNFDPEELNKIEERLGFLSDLKRKYGKTIEQLIAYKSELQLKIERIENNAHILEEMRQKQARIKEDLLSFSRKLSNMRRKIAEELENMVSKELDQLGIRGVLFKVHFDEKEISADGIDRVEFMISTNPGEPLKPLSKVASGGEMSRIMLAFKKVFSEVDGIDTLIFDEIDTGISGQAVQAVAEKILELSLKRQIICITHMPQIASLADTHYYIRKVITDNRTYTKVEKLDDRGRIYEISRIISGDNITPLSISHSKEMIAIANKLKEKIAQ
ncbi:DNA repair protein RecN (Recombination protein N) [Caldanaerobius fijiensis DSM 17918]|uniref:DNA repair protein RecN n=1 Tax=Caldanaerobius fijiensis DSM 17918 TaxID=1121256 RepID=A0A1M4U8S2_9THEO|nr:DNA repair protein RecN [Caldanaerobius fijiensis]SHE53084.1 DNA repair protein RecN (Recombination protein N) [Caldanaerobius fijiensis DSM 17918]